jgi:competence protein ComEC
MFDGFGEFAAQGGPQMLRDAVRQAGIPIRPIWSGDKLRLGPDAVAFVLHPPRIGVVGSDNANSITLAVEYGGRRVLLPGDLESPGLDDVMAELPYDCNVLLAPHHGSRQSDPPGFAAWSTPELVIISGAGGNEADPAAATYREAGADVLHTHRHGMVRVLLRQDQIRPSTWGSFERSLPSPP